MELLSGSSASSWLVVLVGLAVAGFAAFQLYVALATRFRIELDLLSMSPKARWWTFACGRAGYAARGAAHLIAGGAIVYAGWLLESGEVRDIGGAFRALAELWFGPALLIGIALGLIAYGLYLVLAARYLRLIATW